MKKVYRSSFEPNLMANSGTLRADILGLLQLLLSARISLEQHCTDQSCTRMISNCISEFRKRYEISDADFSEGLMWAEPSAPALMRLLVYAQAEATDTLNDVRCAEALEKCIASLMKVYELSPRHLYGNAVLHS